MNLLIHAATIDKVKVGTRVFDSTIGWGVVRSVDGTIEGYPIDVEIGEDMISYTADGKYEREDQYPSLFLIDIFNGTKPPEPEIDWEKVPMDTPVTVGEQKDGETSLRRFCCYLPNGEYKRFICFFNSLDGQHALTRKETGGVIAWTYCKLAPGVEVRPEWLKAPL